MLFLLHVEDFARDFRADTGRAALRGDLAVLLDHHRAIDALARAAAEQRVGVEPLKHAFEGLRKEIGLEICAGLLGRGDIEIAADRRCALLGQRRGGEYGIGAAHHITSISACSAPAALIAWRIEIRSRGPTPRALRLLTSSCRLTPPLTTAMR